VSRIRPGTSASTVTPNAAVTVTAFPESSSYDKLPGHVSVRTRCVRDGAEQVMLRCVLSECRNERCLTGEPWTHIRSAGQCAISSSSMSR
jgi:hypothetical protein